MKFPEELNQRNSELLRGEKLLPEEILARLQAQASSEKGDGPGDEAIRKTYELYNQRLLERSHVLPAPVAPAEIIQNPAHMPDTAPDTADNQKKVTFKESNLMLLTFARIRGSVGHKSRQLLNFARERKKHKDALGRLTQRKAKQSQRDAV
jgi:hypothetical protein